MNELINRFKTMRYFRNIIYTFLLGLALGITGCLTGANSKHEQIHASTENEGFLVTWQKMPSRVGDATAFTVVAVDASSSISLPTNIPPSWTVIKTNDSKTVILAGTAPIGSSIGGLSLDFAADFSGTRRSTNVLIKPAAFVSEDKSPKFAPCPGTQLILCHNVVLGRKFEGDTNMLNVTVKIDSTGSASDSGNFVQFEAGQFTREDKFVSGGNSPGNYESFETHSDLPNWVVTSGTYRVLIRGQNIDNAKVYGIQTIVP